MAPNMLSRRVPAKCGRDTASFRYRDKYGLRPDGLWRAARMPMLRRSSSGPLDSGDAKSSSDQPKRPPHPEMDGTSLDISSGASSIPDALPYMGSQSDWREFRAKLVSQSRASAAYPAADEAPDEWAHVIPKPEKGALLLAHPLLFQQTQTYFHRAAILLLEHGDLGSFGIILNRPSELLIRDVSLSRPQTQFADCRLYIGGDVGTGEVQVVHPYGQLSGASEVVKGVYTGGMEAARDAVDAGWALAKNFRWYSAYAGWGPGQLLMECKRGVWFAAAASPKVLLEAVEPGQGPKYWHKMMGMLGGDYAALSTAVQKRDDVADTS